MQGPPTFLVLDELGDLHAYYREDILKIDLATNRDEPPQQVFKLATNTMTISYRPVAISDLIPVTAEPASIDQPHVALLSPTTPASNERTPARL